MGSGQAPAIAIAAEHIDVAQGGGGGAPHHVAGGIALAIAIAQPGDDSDPARGALTDRQVGDAHLNGLQHTTGGILAALIGQTLDHALAGDGLKIGRQTGASQHPCLGGQPGFQQAANLDFARFSDREGGDRAVALGRQLSLAVRLGALNRSGRVR